MSDARYILFFEDCDDDCLGRVGGKSTGLGNLIRAGIPVPPGFAVTTDAYRSVLASNGMEERIAHLLDQVDPEDLDRLENISQEIRTTIETATVPAEVEREIRSGYDELTRRCLGPGGGELPVAVRSSATAEDLPGASFAGQQDTFLWVIGPDEVIEHAKRCWSSLYTARAISYRIEQGFEHERVLMSICIQKMVNARVAGVMFTLNPINGDRSKIAIDASWGLGESVASGEVTPDNYLVDKIALRLATRTISSKEIEYRPDRAAGRVVRSAVPEERRDVPCLSENDVLALARLGRQAESYLLRPQDLEWAIDDDLPPEEAIVLLQSRPETVWSERDREMVTTAEKSTMDYIVARLLAGTRVRGEEPDSAGSGGGP